MKITTPSAILISALLLALTILLRPDGIPYIDSAKADVAGMNRYDLKLDWDFKNAVKDIVENCDVTGHVDDGYLYSADVSC